MLTRFIFIQLIYLKSESREQIYLVAVEDYNCITEAKVNGLLCAIRNRCNTASLAMVGLELGCMNSLRSLSQKIKKEVSTVI